jgi:hypothetical protein
MSQTSGDPSAQPPPAVREGDRIELRDDGKQPVGPKSMIS